MSQRVVRAGYNPYVTPSNIMEFKKTPEGKLIFVKKEKTPGYQKCGDCKEKLEGVVAARPAAFARLKRCQRKVNRVYGGTLCAKCVEIRVMKSFFAEEKKQLMKRGQ